MSSNDIIKRYYNNILYIVLQAFFRRYAKFERAVKVISDRKSDFFAETGRFEMTKESNKRARLRMTGAYRFHSFSPVLLFVSPLLKELYCSFPSILLCLCKKYN